MINMVFQYLPEQRVLLKLNISVRQIQSLAEYPASAWDQLVEDSDPFLKHAFLAGLEYHRCLEGHGWHPCHVIAESGGETVGALPLYVKTNSTGEFVFDWSWADAYERAGGRYYPKLVSAIPFTPVAGPRLLVRKEITNKAEVMDALYEKARRFARKSHFSGIHILFPDEPDRERMKYHRLLLREGCQYQWYNDQYTSFDDFLSRLTAKKRKQIRHERKIVRDSGIVIEEISGPDITDEHWEIYHGFYRSTFYRKWGEPRLTLDFFRSLSNSMSGSPVLFMASYNGEYVAGAFAIRGTDTLFGRHWGCSGHFPFLHFELCYYRTIEYCIRHGFNRLDAGVQGEHKLSRGFIPVRTWSAHWIADSALRDAVAHFLDYEQNAIEDYINDLQYHLAYKAA